MIADAASGRGPAGAVRAPESRPALVALFGAVRLGIAALGLLGGALLLRGRKPARAWLSGFGGGLAAVSVLEPLLLGVPLGWPAAGGAIAGALVLLLGRAQPAAGEDRV
ncbi:MAG: hypothetical protein D6718_11755 [Acidobacteria bacterium]|nr:MAG: hypothetical protein D6718_11755 [Acidobacteriota bacterium]